MILRLFIVPPRDGIGRDEKSLTCVYIRDSYHPVGRPSGRRRRERCGRRDLNLNRAGRGDTRAPVKEQQQRPKITIAAYPPRPPPTIPFPSVERPTPFPGNRLRIRPPEGEPHDVAYARPRTNKAMQILGGLIIHKGN